MTQRVVNYTYGTGNPVLPDGSIDVRDGIDNLQSMDVFMNAPEDTYNQRDGEIVRTVSGMNNEFDTMIGGMNNEFDAQILNMGFTRIGTFAAGATLTNPRQTLLWDIADGGDGQEYGWSGAFPKVVPAASTPASTGGISVGAWIGRFDPELRIQVREALRRSYAEAGYTLVDGSFEVGGTVTSATDVLLYEANGIAYSWGGPMPKIVPAGSTPSGSGGVGLGAWQSVGYSTLREELAKTDGAALVGGVAQQFNSVSDMVASHVVAGRLYKTLGYSAANDKGGAHYLAQPVGTIPKPYADQVADNGVVLALSEVIISPSMFGAKNDGADYKDNIEACINDGREVQFTSDHTASSLRYGRHGATIHQDGFAITGIAEALTETVLEITARYATIYGVKVNADFRPYNQAVRWHSLNVNDPSNNTIIFGMELLYCGNGLVYGNRPGEPVVDAPQSENQLYGFRCRGVKVPFVGNQPNGFLSVFAPIFDCNPYEQSLQPGYVADTWGVESLAFLNNKNNALSIHGGELLKTTSVLGVGWEGGNVSLHGVTNEIGGTRARVTGNVDIYGELGGYMAGDSVPMYVCGAGDSGTVTINGGRCARASGVASYSGASIISNNGAFIFRFRDCQYTEWKAAQVGDNTADLSTVRFAWLQGATQMTFTASATRSTRATIATSGAWVGVNFSETLLSSGSVTLSGSAKGGAVGTVGTVKNPPPVNSVFLVPTYNAGSGAYGSAILSISPDGTVISNTATVELLLAGVSYLV